MNNTVIQGYIETIATYINTLNDVREAMISIELPLDQGGTQYADAFEKVVAAKKGLLKTIDELNVAIAKNDAGDQTTLLEDEE